MRFKAKVDRNHGEIVKALRQCGCSVQSLAALGHGVPDLLVARCGELYLMEIKDGEQPLSKRRLTEDETAWREKWKSEVHVVTSREQALKIVGITIN